MWLTLLKLLLSIASAVATHVRDKRLLAAGEAEAVLRGVREADDAIRRARAAAARVDELPDDGRYDRDRRD